MKKPETKFRESIYKDLDALQLTWWESIQQKAIRATPDILMCVNGYFVALEFKKDQNESPSPLQLYKHKEIKKAKGFCFVVHPDNWGYVYNILKKLG